MATSHTRERDCEAKSNHTLGHKLRRLQKDEKLTDFKIITLDDAVIPCHKAVIAAMSPVLETMLVAEFQEARSNSTTLPHDAMTVESLLQYMYTGKDYLDTKTAGALYCLAHYLQMDDLVKSCEIFLKENMNKDVCLEAWRASRIFENKAVAGIAKCFVLSNFNQFCNNRDITEISLTDFAELIQDPFLNSSGSSKCEAAWVWFIGQETPENEVCDKVIQALIHSKDVENADIKGACNAAVAERDAIEMIPDFRRVWTESCSKLIWGGDVRAPFVDSDYLEDECLVILRGEEKAPHSPITALNFKQKSWYSFPTPEKDFGFRFAICAKNGDIYFSGGTMTAHNRHFRCYLMYERRWEDLGYLPNGRENHAMVTVKGIIYFVGGTSARLGLVVDAFDTKTKQWSVPGDLAHAVSSASTTVDNECIYLVGGSPLNKSGPLNIVQCFDTRTGYGWVLTTRLPFGCKMQTTQTVFIDGVIYIIHKGTVYIYRVESEIETVCTLEKPPVRGFGATAFGDQIMIFGGEGDDFQLKKYLIQFDTKTRQSFTLPLATPKPLKDFAFTKVNLKTAVLHGADEINTV